MTEYSTPSNSPLRSCLEEALRLANLNDSFMTQQIDTTTDTENINERLASLDAKLENSGNEHLFTQAIIGELKAEISVCKKTMESYAADLNKYKIKSDIYVEEISQLKYEVNDLNYEVAEANDFSIKLGKELNALQQYTRRESIEISGIPDNVHQRDLEATVIDLLRRIGVYQLEANDISACHRLKRRRGDRSCNVIVKFVNRKRVFECLSNRKHIRDTIHEYPNMYIHENLCPSYRSVFEDCKDLKINNRIKKVWTHNGIVHIKKSDNYHERPKKIFHADDIKKYFPPPD